MNYSPSLDPTVSLDSTLEPVELADRTNPVPYAAAASLLPWDDTAKAFIVPTAEHVAAQDRAEHVPASVGTSRLGLVQQLEVFVNRRSGWFCVTRSNSLIAFAAALVFMVPAGIGVLLLRHTTIGSMFLTSPVIGFSIMFLSLVALCSMAIRGVSIALERNAMRQFQWPTGMPNVVTQLEAGRLLELFRNAPSPNSIVQKRIVDGLCHFSSGKSLEETRAFTDAQAEIDAEALHASFSTINLIVWTLPILGFIGTVWGIGLAIGPFAMVVQDAAELDGIKDGLISVIAGLSTAFETTFLALVASVLIMFPKSAVQKHAEATLGMIEERVNRELLARLKDRVVVDRLEPESLLNAFNEILSTHQMQWSNHTEKLASLLSRQLGQQFESVFLKSAELSQQVCAKFDESLAGTSAEMRQACQVIERSVEKTISTATKTIEVLDQVGSKADQRLGDLLPQYTRITQQFAEVLGQSQALTASTATHFDSINDSFKRIHQLLLDSNDQLGRNREVRLPAAANDALLYLGQTMAPLAKLIKQQIEVQNRVLVSAPPPPVAAVEETHPNWLVRLFFRSPQPNMTGANYAKT
jgi:biopolymer transport protein ExbB/TolQ